VIVTKLQPEEREVPHEPGNYLSFRCLSGLQLEEAEAASTRELVERMGAETLHALRPPTPPANGAKGRAAAAVDEVDEARRKDPLIGYSPAKLIEFGLVSWRGPNYDDVPMPIAAASRAGDASVAETKAGLLDKPTLRWAALQVLEVSRITEGEGSSSGRGSDRTSVTAATPRSDSEESG